MVAADDGDAPMSGAPQPIIPGSGSGSGSAFASASASAQPVTKPKRRFAPQLIEQTTKSSSNRIANPDAKSSSNTNTGTGSNRTISNATQSTKDASVQANESDMPARPTKTIRRFAPVPIETTFDSYRVANKNPHGPAPEPTPDPSPTTSQSSLTFSSTGTTMAEPTETKEQEKKPKRRFAPQLIETSRRARRAGQEGPATQPTDKTDITPGTNHIYAPKPKRKHGVPQPNKSSVGLAHATAEKDDEALPRFLTPRRQRPMTSGLNTRRSTRTNSYHPDLDTILSSESGNSSEGDDTAAAPALNLGAPALSDTRSDYGDTWSTRSYDLRSRRESCDEEISGYLLGIAAREAHRQREFEQALSAFPNGVPPLGVEHFFVRDNSEDDLQIGDDEPPLRHGPSQLLRRKSTDPGWAVKEMRAHAEKLARMRAETHGSLDDSSDKLEITPPPEDPLWTAPARRESRDSAMGSSMGPILPTHSPALFAKSPPGHDKPFTPPASTGLRASPFGMPFAFRTGKTDDAELGKMRKAASPPMLGADLSFRTCPSPQYTRMEPNQPYSQFDRLEKNQRDASGATGLWRGYCSSQTNTLETPALQPPALLRTPGACSPIDPFSSAFGASVNGSGIQSPAWTSGGKPTSLHKQTLSGLGEKIERHIGRKEREETILAEFDDAFVTQVYNYLSLCYPATARDFDDELSKISGICIEELRKDDNVKVGKGFMLEREMNPSRENTDGSSGGSDSSNTDSSGDERMVSPYEYERRSRHKPPRWKALKLYIREWARQHPALNNDDGSGPPAWGVRARRGSWAI
ncbi:hypothetical protein EKO27_g3425 [Xylaria grammica]|uniref:Uncharacterized protein n=1 Tax=Xylaria grammica TaxID=363999 RepID=A0A439DBA9_9PEZI|nr:hypothetical protein EKO27_g3425 [Xylaria grammica]